MAVGYRMEKEEFRKLIKKFLVIAFLVVTLIFSATFFWVSYDAVKSKKIIDMNIIVSAKIIKVTRDITHDSTIYPWIGVYEYTDRNGETHYFSSGGYKNKEEAENDIGKEKEIFIDDKGNYVFPNVKLRPGLYLSIAIILLILAIADILIFMVFWKKIKSRRKRKQ